MYTIRSAGIKGLGVFANTLIPRGTRIFSERPLLAIRQDQDAGHIYVTSQLLSASERAKLLELSHHITWELTITRWSQALGYTISRIIFAILARLRTPGGGGTTLPEFALRDHVRILSIFRSNAFNLGSRSVFQQGVFHSISRINHSCVPNAQGTFHDGMGRLNVHATRDIQVDEELTLSYLHEQGAVREARQTRLLSGYGFSCECPACDMNLEKGRHGEDGRVKMQEALGEYSNEIAEGGIECPEKELEMIKRFISLLEVDGIAGRELSTLYLEAAKLNENLGRLETALACAERGLEIEEDCLGRDHVLYLESLEKVEKLRKLR